MESTAYLRRQALFCLRLSQFCPDDDPLTALLTRKAAQYHEKALRTEFEAEFDPGERDWEPGGGGEAFLQGVLEDRQARGWRW